MMKQAPVISYSLSELHELFKGGGPYPSYSTFRKWLDEVPGLNLTTGGENPTYTKILTPAQVELIFNYHGRPEVKE